MNHRIELPTTRSYRDYELKTITGPRRESFWDTRKYKRSKDVTYILVQKSIQYLNIIPEHKKFPKLRGYITNLEYQKKENCPIS